MKRNNHPCDSNIKSHLDCHESLRDSRNDDNLPINNSSICGGSFVFLKFFRLETRLGVCEILKIFKSAKNAPKTRRSRSFFSKDELSHGVRYA